MRISRHTTGMTGLCKLLSMCRRHSGRGKRVWYLCRHAFADCLPQKESRKKQRYILDKNRFMRHIDFNDDKECAEAIRNNDANDIELKKCQREYHEKFMKILPASKVFRIIRSEDKFHRRVFRKAFNRRGK